MNRIKHLNGSGSTCAHKGTVLPRANGRRIKPFLHDFSPAFEDFRSQVLHGLRQTHKSLPCKFFYDQRGSELFDQICDLDEYYLTRTETAILSDFAGEMAAELGPRCRIVEYGSGSSRKTRLLLERVPDPAAYVPLDISREHLVASAEKLALAFPQLNILPVCADYTREFSLPDCPEMSRTVIYFPGSTIGNFEPYAAREFLRLAAQQAGRGGGLLIGVDLKKDPCVLHSAYNDAAGVTASFNLNLLKRINRELRGTFDTGAFAHYAHFNPRLGRIEMHLISRVDQTAVVSGTPFHFREGETIFTESSYKYTADEFASLAQGAGWTLRKTWMDGGRLFSVHYLSTR